MKRLRQERRKRGELKLRDALDRTRLLDVVSFVTSKDPVVEAREKIS